jgi:vacuolar-type H+-ATPase subunit H
MYLLERLEEVLGSGTRLPFTSRTLVDDEECFNVLDQIRLSLPQEIRQARAVYADREALIAEAQAEAAQIVENAESEASERLRDHRIVRDAEARAAEVVARAERRADQVRREADGYAYQVLLDLDRRLESLSSTVRGGLRSLQPGNDAPASYAEDESVGPSDE